MWCNRIYILEKFSGISLLTILYISLQIISQQPDLKVHTVHDEYTCFQYSERYALYMRYYIMKSTWMLTLKILFHVKISKDTSRKMWLLLFSFFSLDCAKHLWFQVSLGDLFVWLLYFLDIYFNKMLGA